MHWLQNRLAWKTGIPYVSFIAIFTESRYFLPHDSEQLKNEKSPSQHLVPAHLRQSRWIRTTFPEILVTKNPPRSHHFNESAPPRPGLQSNPPREQQKQMQGREGRASSRLLSRMWTGSARPGSRAACLHLQFRSTTQPLSEIGILLPPANSRVTSARPPRPGVRRAGEQRPAGRTEAPRPRAPWGPRGRSGARLVPSRARTRSWPASSGATWLSGHLDNFCY